MTFPSITEPKQFFPALVQGLEPQSAGLMPAMLRGHLPILLVAAEPSKLLRAELMLLAETLELSFFFL